MPRNNLNSSSDNINKTIAKYQVAIDKNISESEILWNRYNAMLLFHSILITVIGLTYQNNISLPWFVTIFLPIAGVITCYLWYSITSRGFRWIENWITFARSIEESKPLNDSNLNPINMGNNYRKEDKGWPKTETASKIMIFIIAILYFIFLFYSIKPIIFHEQTYGNLKKLKPMVGNYQNWKIKY